MGTYVGPLTVLTPQILSLLVVTVLWVAPALQSIPAALLSLVTLLPSWAFVCLDTLCLHSVMLVPSQGSARCDYISIPWKQPHPHSLCCFGVSVLR